MVRISLTRPLNYLALCFLALAAMPHPAEAWGRSGHRLTCELAYRHLEPSARQWVDEVLKGENAPFAETCLWADRVKRTTRPETYSHHYINIPQGKMTVDLERDCARGDCVVRAIERHGAELRDPSLSREQKRDALKFLSHYVGDIHQPLHCGRLEDLGGNLVETCFFGDCGVRGEPIKLHKVWDTSMLNRYGEPWTVLFERLWPRMSWPQDEIWDSGDPLDWAQESLILAEDFVYGELPPWGVDENYYLRGHRIVEERLIQGALRLAALLNELSRSSPDLAGPLESSPE